jgi:hypothetical protein
MDNETQVQVLCNDDDPNLDVIAARTAIIQKAARDNMLVAISCKDGDENVILLAVVSKDGGEEYIQYSPIAQLFYPEDESFYRFTPPEAAIALSGESDVQH